MIWPSLAPNLREPEPAPSEAEGCPWWFIRFYSRASFLFDRLPHKIGPRIVVYPARSLLGERSKEWAIAKE